MSGSKVSRDDIVSSILSIRLEQGSTLKQVQVSQEVYSLAKKFVVLAPNFLSGTLEPYRFKVLNTMESNSSIYNLLMADAVDTAIENAGAKISGWRGASKALLRYALNLLLAPKRPEFQILKLSTPFYVYQVAKKLKGAEKILVSMGYKRVSDTQEVQELKYQDDTSNNHIAEIAADLVILDSELSRVDGLVSFVLEEKYPISLRHLLQARSHQSETFKDAIHSALSIATTGILPSHPVPPTHPDQPPWKQPEGYLHEPNQGRHPEPRHQFSQPSRSQISNDSCQQRAGLEAIPRDNASRGNQPVAQDLEHAVRNPYHNLPLDPDVEGEMMMRQANRGLEQKRKNSSPEDNVCFQRTNSEFSEESPYVNVKHSNGVVHLDNVEVSIRPDPCDLPEPIVQDAAELEQLQMMNTGDDFNAVSLITDARSDHVSLGGVSFESLASLQTPECDAFNKAVEDAWKVDAESPKYHSNGSNGSQHSHPHTSGSEDIYGSENNSIPSLGRKQSEVNVSRQDAPVSDIKASVKECLAPHKPLTAHNNDSDSEDSETVRETARAAQPNYYDQVERNRPTHKDFKHLEKHSYWNPVEHVSTVVNKGDLVNQETSHYQMEIPFQNELTRTSEIDHSVQTDPVTQKLYSDHTCVNDPVLGKDSPPNRPEAKPRLNRPQSGDKPTGDRIPVPTPRSPKNQASHKPQVVPRQKIQSAGRIEKRHSSPVSSAMNSLEAGEQSPKSHTSPLSSLDAHIRCVPNKSHLVDSVVNSLEAGERLPKPPDSSMDAHHLCIPDKSRLVDKGADTNFSSFEVIEMAVSDDVNQERVSMVPDSNFPSFERIEIIKPVDSQSREMRATVSTVPDSSGTASESCLTSQNYMGDPPSCIPISTSDTNIPLSLVNESHRLRASAYSKDPRKISIDGSTIRVQRPESKMSSVGAEKQNSTGSSNLDIHSERKRECRQVSDVPKMDSEVMYSQTLQPVNAVAVSGTWTCSFCFNIIFDGASVCDVCGNKQGVSA